MNLTKKDISQNVTNNCSLSNEDGPKLVESFLKLISVNAKSMPVKISGFGSFIYKTTPERIGRNPKTNDLYEIKSFKRLVFRASTRLKKLIN
jgi:integration host factor subunit alpha